MGGRLDIFALEGLPMVQPGDDLAALIGESLAAMGERLHDGDVVVVAQKIVSKAEGRQVPLAGVTPSSEAQDLAERTGKDPRAVELVLRESTEILRAIPGVLITRHRLGFVMANAGIDRSNIEGSEGTALLLPEDPDASARRIRTALEAEGGASLAVIVSDSVGRAWRYGTVGLAIGCAGVEPLQDQRGGTDLYGRTLEVTEPALADELASAAQLVMGEAREATPVAIIRGGTFPKSERPASVINRSVEEDLFR